MNLWNLDNHPHFVISFSRKKHVISPHCIFYMLRKKHFNRIQLFNTLNWHSLGFILSYDFRFIQICVCAHTLPIAFVFNGLIQDIYLSLNTIAVILHTHSHRIRNRLTIIIMRHDLFVIKLLIWFLKWILVNAIDLLRFYAL